MNFNKDKEHYKKEPNRNSWVEKNYRENTQYRGPTGELNWQKSNFEDNLSEIFQFKKQKEERVNESEQNLWDLLDFTKCEKINITGVPEGEEVKIGR